MSSHSNFVHLFFNAPDILRAHIEERAVNPYQLVLDVILLGIILYVITRRAEKPERPLSEREIAQEIEDFHPDPLFPSIDDPLSKLDRVPIIKGSTVTEVTLDDGRKVLHMARTNFLGMINNPRVEESALKALRKYGTGTCGPRGFYGTIDIHLELEERIRKFLDAEDCLIYSFGFSTVASAIPAFAGRDDLLIVDKGVNFAVQTGVKLSRSEVVWFNHNDMADLERILIDIEKKDKRSKRPVTRRYIVIEGLYYNTGDLANLPKIFELKNKYCYRTIMDDSYGIGTIGKTGRGTAQHFNIPVKEIDILTGNLEGVTSSIGGFCCASKPIVYHQRLNSTGYVYSASLPPLLAAASITAFDIMDEQPQLFGKLGENVEIVQKRLREISGIRVASLPISPVIHLQLENATGDQFTDEETLQLIVDKALEKGVLLTRAKYVYGKEYNVPKPSIRVTVSAALSSSELDKACTAISDACKEVIPNRPKTVTSVTESSGVQKRK